MFKGIQAQLLFTFLLASILPLALGGIVFFSLVKKNITVDTFQRVSFVRDSKSSEIRQYLAFARRQAENYAQSSNVRYSIGDFYGFSYALRQISTDTDQATDVLRKILQENPGVESGGLTAQAEDRLLREAIEYANAYRQFHPGFVEFLEGSEFDNLYLVDRRGLLVYSISPDPYFGRLLPADDSHLAQVHARLKASDANTIFSDFVHDPVTGEVAAHLAVTVSLYGRSSATLILRLPARGLQNLLETSDIVTLVSSENRVIASSAGSDLQLGSAVSLPAGMRDPAGITTFAAGLNGAATLSAWNRLGAPFPDWLIVAEISQAEAFATSRDLRSAFLLIGVVAASVLAVISFLLARSITGPIRNLATAAGAIAEGALDHPLPEYGRPREYASLSQAVSQMRVSLRDQLELIGKKNTELQTHLRQIEDKNVALQEADRMKDQFLANTSHELRTPLNGIIGISETLETGVMGQLEPGQRSQLRLISFSARRLSRLVDDLLDIYRIREGRMRLDLKPVDVVQSLRNVVQLAQPLLQEHAALLRIDAADDLPAVQADPMRFEQILFNLVSNAIRHSGPSEIVISAVAKNDVAPAMVNVAIRDQGPGIAPESLEKIFHPLEQISSNVARSGKDEGTGLGLTIARNLAVLMSGTIEVSSALGEGSVFTLSLPATDASAFVEPASLVELPSDYADETPAQASADPLTADGNTPYILLVDDEPINLQVLHNVLKPQGYRVSDCANGTDAITSVNAQKPDLIVLDVMMPGLSGLDVVRQLRQRFSLLDLPVILLTARSRTGDLIEGFEAGANDYVVKPFVKDELLSRIRTLLEASRAKQHALENTEMRDEITRRIQVEDALRLSQRRMKQMLEVLDDGLVCVDARGVLTFANHAARQMFKDRIELRRTRLEDLIPQQHIASLHAMNDDDDGAKVRLTLNEQDWDMHMFEMQPEAGAGHAIVFSRMGRSKFVTTIRDAVDTTISEMDAAQESPTPGPHVRDAYRTLLVRAMTETLELWAIVSDGGKKVEFAEQSGIWRVSLDKTSLQTRTLDKYLLIETLPENPRWRDVIRSINFILAEAERVVPEQEISDRITSLRNILEELRQMTLQDS